MQALPVITSTIAPGSIAAFVAEQYALRHVTCKLLKAGVNHTYLITTNDEKFVFRVYSYNWRSEAEISEEVRLLLKLKDAALPVSYPIADKNHQFIQRLNAPEGTRFGVLFTFAPGGKMLNFPADLHYSAGKIMGGIHQQTEDFVLERTKYTTDVLLSEPLPYIATQLPAETAEMQWLKAAQAYLTKELTNVDTTQLRTGAVHLDFWFDNLTIATDGGITLFDFDFCGNGWLCLDIAYYILQLHSTEKVPAERDEKIRRFLEGYESVVKITDEEKRLLPMLGVALYFFYLGVQCRRFDDWSNTFINDVYLKRYINLLVRKYFEDQVYSGSLDAH